jgi:hypothetical protein
MPFAHFVTNRAITLTNNQKIKTKQQVPDTSLDGLNIKFLSRNLKKCIKLVQPIEKCRKFAFNKEKKIVHAHSDL